MPPYNDKLYRILDANFNRAKEGLRVCEDIGRFILDEKVISSSFKELRQKITRSILKLDLKKLIGQRDIERDIGKASSKSELRRRNFSDIFYANAQRVKESLRVLEELAKLINPDVSRQIKNIRYKMYALEKKVVIKC